MKINEGLILPFRFYSDIDKQMRYRGCGRWDQDDITHNEYLISYGCRLLPFQIRRDTNPSDSYRITLINAVDSTSTVISPYINANDIEIKTIGDYDYITYFGRYDIEDTGTCVMDNCLYYVTFDDFTDVWYSELFRVVDVDQDPSSDFRIWSKARGAYRTWDGTDLRITN